jgi:hypothetical protein
MLHHPHALHSTSTHLFYMHSFAETNIDKAVAPATTNIKLYIYLRL